MLFILLFLDNYLTILQKKESPEKAVFPLLPFDNKGNLNQ